MEFTPFQTIPTAFESSRRDLVNFAVTKQLRSFPGSNVNKNNCAPSLLLAWLSTEPPNHISSGLPCRPSGPAQTRASVSTHAGAGAAASSSRIVVALPPHSQSAVWYWRRRPPAIEQCAQDSTIQLDGKLRAPFEQDKPVARRQPGLNLARRRGSWRSQPGSIIRVP